jgi:hypothetical protein
VNPSLPNPWSSTPRCLPASVLGIAFGSVMFVEWLPIFNVRNSPIVAGTIVARVPIQQWNIPRVDFTIQINNANAQVHAYAQQYLMDRVPVQVRFQYSGDPNQEVFLFEHEEDPFWIMAFCWTVSAGLLAFVIHRWWNTSAELADRDNRTQAAQAAVTKLDEAYQ